MRILELGRGSAEEAELLDAATAAHGDWVMAAAPLMSRMWLMRSAWAPGLRYVGGLAEVRDLDGTAGPLSVGGSGLRLEDALAGCLAEAVERTAQVERPGDVVLTAPLDAVRVPEQIRELIDLLVAREPAAAQGAVDWMRARNVTTGAEALVPADWCLRRLKPTALSIPGTAPSTGTAAASTAEDASARGLLELIERDAASLWWLGGASAAALDAESPELAAAARLGAELRQSEGTKRRTHILDITSEFGVPVMAAVAHAPDGTGLALGLAARFSPARAVGSALVELCQMELGLALASSKQKQLGEAALTDVDRRHLARAAAAVADLAPLAAPGLPRRHVPRMTGSDGASALGTRLVAAGIDAWRVDLTRPGSGLNVVKMIAPHLQAMPGDLATARLSAVQKSNGPQRPPHVTIM